jgi:hypothetical protein
MFPLSLNRPSPSDQDSVRQDALEALAQPRPSVVVLCPNRQDDIHEFGWLQRRRIALAEGWENVVLERRQLRLTHAARQGCRARKV